MKERLDKLLVDLGLCESRTKAQGHILAGEVWVAGQKMDKAGTLVLKDAPIEIKHIVPVYVSRGAYKLKAALEAWPFPLQGATCLDVGASTGGFTQVLLEAGAKKVYAVDVGKGQLHYKLQKDPRVISYEKTHILKVTKEIFDPPPQIVTIDVSFISLTKILSHILTLLDSPAYLYVLIKPQFEAGKDQVPKGGVIKDVELQAAVLKRVLDHAKSLGLEVLGVEKSPLLGADGNQEWICALRL